MLISLEFTFTLNESVSIGDVIYIAPFIRNSNITQGSAAPGGNITGTDGILRPIDALNYVNGNITEIGVVKSLANTPSTSRTAPNTLFLNFYQNTPTVARSHIIIDVTNINYFNNLSVQQALGENMIFFSKDNVINLSTVLGYYAKVGFKNNSMTKAELFRVSAEINKSSS